MGLGVSRVCNDGLGRKWKNGKKTLDIEIISGAPDYSAGAPVYCAAARKTAVGQAQSEFTPAKSMVHRFNPARNVVRAREANVAAVLISLHAAFCIDSARIFGVTGYDGVCGF
eukprot:3044592-Prymnesium_polylepis.1